MTGKRKSGMSNYRVKIVEVGPRDGLQNEKQLIDTATKVELINRLSDIGFQAIESGAFVSPKWIPQMADTKQVLEQIERRPLVRYPVLIPNLQGMENALATRVDEIAIFGAASETFSQKNINSSIDQSLSRFEPVCRLATQNEIPIRGYVSCVLGCPYEGHIEHSAVLSVTERLLELGCYEISVGDTIGVGTPNQTRQLLKTLLPVIGHQRLAVHFHDTYGLALANITVALENDVRVIDSSVGGLGGCPYAHGASGNVATEDVLYMLNGMGLETGIDLDEVIRTAYFITDKLGRQPNSKVSRALAHKV